MQTDKKNLGRGLTLVEITLAMTLISIVSMGTLQIRYFATLDARKADVQMTASRLALSLVQTWAAKAGSVDFDPLTEFASNLTISSDSGPEAPQDFEPLGSYCLLENRAYYFVTLSYQLQANGEPQVLNASIAWLPDNSQTWDPSAPALSFQLTTYVKDD